MKLKIKEDNDEIVYLYKCPYCKKEFPEIADEHICQACDNYVDEFEIVKKNIQDDNLLDLGEMDYPTGFGSNKRKSMSYKIRTSKIPRDAYYYVFPLYRHGFAKQHDNFWLCYVDSTYFYSTDLQKATIYSNTEINDKIKNSISYRLSMSVGDAVKVLVIDGDIEIVTS